MRKFFSILTVIIVLALLSGIGYVIYNITQHQPLQEIAQPAQILMPVNAAAEGVGTFIAIDTIHKGSGSVSVIRGAANQPLLKFNDDFTVTAGPDLQVYISKSESVTAAKDLGEFVSLGRLRLSTGMQVYQLPENYRDYPTVVIWCRAFGVLFSSATLSSPK